ncbi:lysylphosphatidylglycerol synthase transmembrane domain-containing protein [Kitasatospora sp. MAA4]|uniref:lysylphosphatidylglycerol synthase transmembrane domain-containing protein n=1 Tax=Kitasatospora sp. MAA4 TaxID=3035093 RepID=UPI002473A913|nr:lysylphosphatidylglycerol synthase transmembrane domain-containing protein [Kitasatospora sp. MAA4]
MTTGISEIQETGRTDQADQADQADPADPADRTRRRIRPGVLITVVGAVVFGCLLYAQGTRADVDPVRLVREADPGWVLLSVLAAAASYPAAAMGFLGFVPERLCFGRAVLAQLAGAFVKLVAPGGLGGIALNTRFLQRAGITPGRAVSSVGAGQLIGLGLHLLQLAFFLSLINVDQVPQEPSHGTATLVAAGLAAALAGGALAVPCVRRWLLARLRPLAEGSLTRLRDLLRHPGRLAVGVVGQLLVSMTLATSLYCAVRAEGSHPRFAAVAVAFLIGNAVGSAVPTPAGLIGIETATAAVLSATTGLGAATGALHAVVLFRLVTVVLPVLPGWLALSTLQRHKAI